MMDIISTILNKGWELFTIMMVALLIVDNSRMVYLMEKELFIIKEMKK
jgi:hypothetical protein